MGIGSDYVL